MSIFFGSGIVLGPEIKFNTKDLPWELAETFSQCWKGLWEEVRGIIQCW